MQIACLKAVNIVMWSSKQKSKISKNDKFKTSPVTPKHDHKFPELFLTKFTLKTSYFLEK